MSATTRTPQTLAAAGTLADLVREASARNGVAMRYADASGEWVDMTYAELGEQVTALARGLIAVGIERGDRIAIMSRTRPEWTWLDLAALCIGAIVVPVYETSSAEDAAYVLRHSGVRLAACENAEQIAKLPELEQLAVIDGEAPGALTLDELRRRGEEVDLEAVRERERAIQPGDLATVIYTSGTTGKPKGCMLTHANYRANLAMTARVTDIGPDPVFFLFLPLAHALSRVFTFYGLDQGATLAYWRRDIRNLTSDLAATRPTHLSSAPRLFEKVHARVMSPPGRIAPRLVRALVGTRALRPLANRLVFAKVREGLGGRLRLALSGAAPIDGEVLDFFAACGVPIIEGYGMTETSSAHTCNRPEDMRVGTVGPPLDGAEVRIADDGEVLMRGPNVFVGYLDDEEATAAALRDGWLHSGDLGRLDEDGFLTITGRKKDLIITSTGKNISPAAIESRLMRSRWIAHAVVVGDRRPYLVALLSLDPDEVEEVDDRVQAELQQAVDAANEGHPSVEHVRAFAVLDRPLSQDEGELTATMKVKRRVVEERYAALIDSLYSARG
ncbi:MAG: AMP-dependent synthetase/ligase [Thermoleophilaceae bacterium]